jgi:hypothetical protein
MPLPNPSPKREGLADNDKLPPLSRERGIRGEEAV